MSFRMFSKLFIIVTFILSTSLVSEAYTAQNNISQLTSQISACNNTKELASLYCHRARGHAQNKDIAKANQDYLSALKHDYSGWLMNEYALFLYKTGDYKRSYVVADKAIQDFPYMKNKIEKLKIRAKEKYDAWLAKENPETIVVSEQNLKRNQITRYDLAKKTGYKKMRVIKAKNQPSSTGSS